MRRYLVPAVVTLVVVALLAVLAFGVTVEGAGSALAARVNRGQTPRAPNDTVRLQLLGSSRRESLSQLRGKVVMLNVFAGWCFVCQDETPLLRRAQRLLLAHGGELVGMTYQDSSTDAAGYMRRYHLSYPVLLDPGDSFLAPYGVNGVPETFIIGRNGDIIAARTYQLSSQWVKRTLDRVLGLSA